MVWYGVMVEWDCYLDVGALLWLWRMRVILAQHREPLRVKRRLDQVLQKLHSRSCVAAVSRRTSSSFRRRRAGSASDPAGVRHRDQP